MKTEAWKQKARNTSIELINPNQIAWKVRS